MIKIAICDDNATSLNLIKDQILEYSRDIPSLQLNIDTFPSGEDICAAINQKSQYDIVFLDIEMGEVSGIDAGKHIRDIINDNSTLIVYVSAYDGYYKDVYQNTPIAFINKPFSKEEFDNVFTLVLEKLKSYSDVIYLKIGRERRKINKSDIIYFESEKRKMVVVTVNGSFEFYQSVTELMAQLDDPDFIQVQKSYIINLNNVERFTPKHLVMRNNHIAPIGAHYVDTTRKLVNDYLLRNKMHNG